MDAGIRVGKVESEEGREKDERIGGKEFVTELKTVKRKGVGWKKKYRRNMRKKRRRNKSGRKWS